MKTLHTLFHTYVTLNSAELIPLPIYTTDGPKKYQLRLNIFQLVSSTVRSKLKTLIYSS